MITTQFAGDSGNIIVKSKDPFKGWSDPIKLNFDGIDPSIFFDDNGKAYVVHNDGPKRGEELYNGHRVIKIWEYDVGKRSGDSRFGSVIRMVGGFVQENLSGLKLRISIRRMDATI